MLADRAGEVLLSGPAGTGKSRACLEKLNLIMLKYPGSRGLMVRKTAVSLSSTALVTWREHVVPEMLLTGEVEYYGGSSEEPAQYRYRNGSRVMLGGMDKPTKIMSSEYDVIYVQEAIELTETDWEMASSRLRNGRVPYQQLIADTNPSTPLHWLKQRADRSVTHLHDSRHTDNPVLFDAQGNLTSQGTAYMAVLDRLTGTRRLRLRDGKWVAAEGQIFDLFDPAVHVIDAFDIPAHWRRIWTVDFGYRNPFVCQFWAISPDGVAVMYREIYHTRRLVEDHAVKIMDLVSEPDPGYVFTPEPDRPRRLAHHGRIWTEPRPEKIICDHDAEGRETLAREIGRPTHAANKSVALGLEAGQSWFKVDGTRRDHAALVPGARVQFVRSALVERDQDLVQAMRATCTVEELPGYVWLDHRTKEEPVKVDDHGCDGYRYLVMDQTRRGGSGVRVM